MEYIQSTGTQWIATDIIPSTTTTIDIKFQYTTASSSADDRVLGIEQSSKYFILGRFQNNFRFVYGNGSAISVNLATQNTNIHIAKIGYDADITCGVYFDTVAKTNNISSSYVYSSEKLNVFATTNGGYKASNLKVYYLKVVDNAGTVLYDLIPARNLSTSEIGLYDKVGHKWYYNSGTGDFIAGPDKEE